MTEKKLPVGWEEKKLGEYLYLKNGYAFKRSAYIEKSNNSVPIIRISDINGNTASDELAIHTTEKVDGFELQKGDLLIAMSGATTGKLGIYIGNTPAYQNQRVGNLKLKNEGCEEFRNHLMFYLQDEVRKLGYGNAQPNISGKMLEDLDIVLPPLPEQQKLAQKFIELLSMVDHIKQKLERIPLLLKTYRQAVLVKAVSGELSVKWREENNFSAQKEFDQLIENEQSYLNQKVKDERSKILKEKEKLRVEKLNFNVGKLPKGWIFKPFFEFCLLNRGFDLPIQNRIEGSYPILSAGGVIGFHNSYKVKGECVTVGRSGSVGQVFYIDRDCWVLNTALYVKDFGISLPKFVYYKLQTMNLSQYSSSTAVPTLNRNEFMFVPVPIPPREEQKFIVQQVEELLNFAEKLEQQAQQALAKVNLLKQAILAKGFRGELMME